MTDERVIPAFEDTLGRAERVAADRDRTDRLLEDARKKSEKNRGAMHAIWEDFWTLWRLVRAWRNGTYAKVPWRTILFATGAILYFLDPIDIIPDYIPVIGYLDDTVVIVWTARAIHKDLEKFRQWELEQEKVVSAT